MKELAASGFDGVIAKELDCAYASGERSAMRKIKRIRTADCVVGGFRYASKGGEVGSLLLGLYDEEGKLNHVGFSSSFAAPETKEAEGVAQAVHGWIGFYWTCARRSQPLEHGAQRRMGGAEAEAGLRGSLRSFLRRTLSSRHEVLALAAGEKSA